VSKGVGGAAYKDCVEDVVKNPDSHARLPDIYEQYFLYLEQTRGSSQVAMKRKALKSLHDYLEQNYIRLSSLTIEHLDAFMAEFRVPEIGLRNFRSHIRGFLRYLYHEKMIIGKDLASLLTNPPIYLHNKPPRFLRPHEIQQLFSSLKFQTPADIRTYAMVHLAYSLGLRPVEISRMTLDHISFTRGEVTIEERKANNPTILPLSKPTLEAIAAYVVKARARTETRNLFLNVLKPYRPVHPSRVSGILKQAMKQAGLSSATAYWLRHTYAQNLLGMGRSVYEIKEMMGHEDLRSTQRYLHIDTEQMRKVLLNETL